MGNVATIWKYVILLVDHVSWTKLQLILTLLHKQIELKCATVVDVLLAMGMASFQWEDAIFKNVTSSLQCNNYWALKTGFIIVIQKRIHVKSSSENWP